MFSGWMDGRYDGQFEYSKKNVNKYLNTYQTIKGFTLSLSLSLS